VSGRLNHRLRGPVHRFAVSGQWYYPADRARRCLWSRPASCTGCLAGSTWPLAGKFVGTVAPASGCKMIY